MNRIEREHYILTPCATQFECIGAHQSRRNNQANVIGFVIPNQQPNKIASVGNLRKRVSGGVFGLRHLFQVGLLPFATYHCKSFRAHGKLSYCCCGVLGWLGEEGWPKEAG
jgi:hypothetical protein